MQLSTIKSFVLDIVTRDKAMRIFKEKLIQFGLVKLDLNLTNWICI